MAFCGLCAFSAIFAVLNGSYPERIMATSRPLLPVGLLFLSALFLILPGCGDDAPGSGSIDGVELGLHLQLHLKDRARQDGFDAERLSATRALFDHPPPGLDSLRIYTARATLEDEGALDLRMALFPLQGDFSGGYLGVAVAGDGVVYRSRLWGIPAFDTDPESAWENFWRQFEYRKTRAVIDPSSALPDSTVDQFWMGLQADSSEGLGVQDYYHHGRQMIANSFLIRRTMALTRCVEVLDPSWYQDYIAAFTHLDSTVQYLQPWLGDEAASQYRSVTTEALSLLEPIVSHARAGDAGTARSAIVEFRRRTCGSCHNIEGHTLGEGGVRDALMAAFKERGMRRDLYRVGYDVWPAPGEEAASQEIASAIKAILVVLGQSQ